MLVSVKMTFGRAYRVNVTLNGYRVRAFSEKELAYTGGITGIIQDDYSEKDGRVLPHACVSLWQDGRPADTPKNPQMSGNAMIAPATGNYLFEHLAPGQYQITVEVADIAGVKHNITKEATVRPGLVYVSFLFGYLLPPMPSTLRPTATPVNGSDVAASAAPGLAPSSMPAPFPGAPSVMVLICATVLPLRGKRK